MRAAARTVNTGSSRFEMTWQLPQGFRGMPAQPGPSTMRGTMDYVHQRGSIIYPGGTQILFDGNMVFMEWPLPWRHGPTWVRSTQDSSSVDPFDLPDRAMHKPVGLLEF